MLTPLISRPALTQSHLNALCFQVQLVGEVVRALQSVSHHGLASSLLDMVREEFSGVFESYVTACMEESYPDLRSIVLFSRKPRAVVSTADKELAATIKQLWRFAVGIDDVGALPGSERFVPPAVLTRPRAAALRLAQMKPLHFCVSSVYPCGWICMYF
jgi:hypothetical protein